MDSKAFVICVLLTTIYRASCTDPAVKLPGISIQLLEKFEDSQLPAKDINRNGILKKALSLLNPLKLLKKPFPSIGPLQDFSPKRKCLPKMSIMKQPDKNGESAGEKLKKQWLKVNGIKVVNPGSTVFSLLSEHVGETGGEAISWALGIAAAVGAASGVLSPAVGSFSLIAGIATTITDNLWKEQVISAMNDAFAQSHERLNHRMAIMEEYVDENIALLEKGLLTGEFSHMSQYLLRCLQKEDPMPCILDRCEYVQEGLKKFAIYYDEFTKEEIFEDLNVNVENPEKMINWNQKRLQSIQLEKIKRAFANLPLFETYTSQLLYNCEISQFLSMIDSWEEEELQSLDNPPEKRKNRIEKAGKKLNDWFNSFMHRIGMVTRYVVGVSSLLLSGYSDLYLKNKDPERVLEYGIEERSEAEKAKKLYNLQCRIRMNPFNLETCDYSHKAVLKEKELVNSDDKVKLLKTKCEAEFIQGEEKNAALKNNNEQYLKKAQDTILDFSEGVIQLWNSLVERVTIEIEKVTGNKIKKDVKSNGSGRNSIMNTKMMNDTINGVLKKSSVNSSPVQNNPENL